MRAISLFDPWKNSLCTCPKKYSFSPYVGCIHSCLYCYASSYIRHFNFPRIKEKIILRVNKDLREIDKSLYISASNSSDPYQKLEEKLKIFRECLKIFKNNGLKVLILTKSNLVLRDIDILKRMNVIVSITITTLDEKISCKIEPNAPSPFKRLEALEKLSKENIPTVLRIDPIILGLNDNIEDLILKAKEIGVRHIVSSTYKARLDNWKRMFKKFPKEMKRLKKFYFVLGEKISGSYYLPKVIREKVMKKVKNLVEKNGLTFGCCREGFAYLNSKSCDGSHLFYASS
ncbi:MAG: radical SAM protein [Candidatus Aenigmatarchaeota archaeon]